MKTDRQRIAEQRRRIDHLEGRLQTLQEMLTDCRNTIEQLRKENLSLRTELLLNKKPEKGRKEAWQSVFTNYQDMANTVEGSVVKSETTLINM